MVFESLILLLLELLDSCVWSESVLGAHVLEGFNHPFCLQVMCMRFLMPNHLDVSSHSSVKTAIFGLIVTHEETFPCPWTETAVKRGLEFSCVLEPI